MSHSSLSTTQRYIEGARESKRTVVDLVWGVGQLLNVAERTASFDDALGAARDEGAPAAVAGRAFEAKLGVEPAESNRDSLPAHSDSSLAEDHSVIRAALGREGLQLAQRIL